MRALGPRPVFPVLHRRRVLSARVPARALGPEPLAQAARRQAGAVAGRELAGGARGRRVTQPGPQAGHGRYHPTSKAVPAMPPTSSSPPSATTFAASSPGSELLASLPDHHHRCPQPPITAEIGFLTGDYLGGDESACERAVNSAVATCRWLVNFYPIFRMPLDTEGEILAIPHRHRFHGSVFRHRFHLKLRSEPTYCLPMDGIRLSCLCRATSRGSHRALGRVDTYRIHSTIAARVTTAR